MQKPGFQSARKFQCEKCLRLFEEKSRNCPRCDSRSMGELIPIPEKHRDEALRNGISRARRGIYRSE